MSFQTIYRASVYVMLVLATLVLSIDATDDNPIAMLYPVVVAIAAAAALLTVDRNPRWGLSDPVAGVLALGSIGLSYLEWQYDPENLFLLALAHWLVYLQIVLMFRRKTIEVDWCFFLLGLVQVLVGGVISQSDRVGFALFVWALVTMWVLGLFYLHRESYRNQPYSPEPAERPYPNLFDTPFFVSSVQVAAFTLILGGLIFLLMPRSQSVARTTRTGAVTQHLTGFDEEVQLGQLGEILENDSIVMNIEVYDAQDHRIQPSSDLLWRGITMSRYGRGRWRRVSSREGELPEELHVPSPNSRLYRQKIKLEPTDSLVLFGLRPILNVSSDRRGVVTFDERDGIIYRSSLRPLSSGRAASFDYEVTSAVDLTGEETLAQPGEAFPSPLDLRDLTHVPEDIGEELRRIAEPIVRGIPPDDLIGRARALERYLRDSPEFTYTLYADISNPRLDPVLDFLVNRKTGHCEYYASALTLLLRSAGIPARMVNGFKGGDWNTLARVLNVRQLHAHSWVEALVSADPFEPPLWLVLDPTPAREREEAVARVGGLGAHFRQLTDFVRYVWVFYVVGFNAERQRRLIYDPIRNLVSEARKGFSLMGQALTEGVSRFPNARAIFSLEGFIVSFVGMVILLVLIGLTARGYLRLRRRLRGDSEDDPALAASVAFYRRLSQLLASCDLHRPATETPREFAHRAEVVLRGRSDHGPPVADVPALVVSAYYGVRFGHHALSPQMLKHLEQKLDALESSLRSETA